MIRQWIDSAAAHWGGAAYLQDAAGSGSADLRRPAARPPARGNGAWTAPTCRPGPAWPSGWRTRSSMPAPWSPSSARAGWWFRSTRPRPAAEHWPQCWTWPGRKPSWPTAAPVFRGSCVLAAGDRGPNGGRARPRLAPARPRADPGGIFLCTSGTSGTPKGSCCVTASCPTWPRAWLIRHRLTPADRGYCCLPLFHVNAEVVGLLATLAARACLVLDRKFSRRGFWAMIEEQEITWINAVPAIITILAMDPAAGPAAHCRPLRPLRLGPAGTVGATAASSRPSASPSSRPTG